MARFQTGSSRTTPRAGHRQARAHELRLFARDGDSVVVHGMDGLARNLEVLRSPTDCRGCRLPSLT